MDDLIETVRGWVDPSARIVALTGAGISTESGIPDFRGPQGVWTTNPKAERLSNIQHYMSDPEVRSSRGRAVWIIRRGPAGPNAGHRALVELERRGTLHALVTQNIDGLHQQAGHAPDKVIEVHGTMREVMCMECGWRGPMGLALDRVRAGEDDPHCERCGGILKSATISFGQSLDPAVINRAMRAAERADLLLGDRHQPAGLPGRRRRAAGEAAGARRDRQRRADAVRRHRGRRPARADRRDPSGLWRGRPLQVLDPPRSGPGGASRAGASSPRSAVRWTMSGVSSAECQ